MKYTILINQKSIVDFNKKYNKNLDIIDATIIEYLNVHSSSKFCKKNYIIVNNEIYYLISYQNIIQQIPLSGISTSDGFSRRIKKLEEYGIIKRYNKKISTGGTKTYFSTNDIFHTFFYSTEQDVYPCREADEEPCGNNNDYIINDNTKKNIKKESINSIFKQYNKQIGLLIELFPKRSDVTKRDLESAKNHICKALLKTDNKDQLLQEIKNGLSKYILSHKDIKFIKKPNNWFLDEGWTAIYENVDKEQEEVQKDPLNDDPKSDDYFAYRFNEDIASAFSYKECIELTESIKKSKPNAKKYSRTLALIEWLKDKHDHELTKNIKEEVVDIYKGSGYDVWVEKAIKDKPDCRWVLLLELLGIKL